MASQDDLRGKAEEIAERCKVDADFVKQLVNNPQATLEAAGIPPENVNEVLVQTERGINDACFLSICISTDKPIIT